MAQRVAKGSTDWKFSLERDMNLENVMISFKWYLFTGLKPFLSNPFQ